MPKDKSSGKKLADMMYGSDQIRATPQSRVTGPIANALRKAQQFASQYEVSPRIPLLGGTGVDELLSLPEAASLMEDISYNGPGALIRGGNVATGGIGTFRPDPRIASVADVAGTATGVGSLATKGATKGALAAGRAGSRLADKAVPQIMERGGLGADILSGMAQGTQSRIFIGPKAKTFNQAKADEAVRLEQQGVDPAQIWLATGTFRGADGILRQEIDDRAAKFLSADERKERLDATKAKIAEMKQKIKPTPQKDLFPKALTEAKKEVRDDISILQGDVKGRERNPRTQGLLAQHIFEHPELYAAYPELQNVKFVTEGGNDGTLGALSIMPSRGFIPGSMEIDIYDKGLRSNPTSTSLHEMQHAVQTLEGMGPGGNPTFAFSDPKASEMLQQERLKMLKPLPYEDFVRQGGYTDMEQAGRDYAKYTKDLQGGIDPAYDRMLQQRVAMEYYKRLAGEAEARAVQDRQMMTPAQRMETPPPASYDVPQEDLIVKPPREYADGGRVHISDNPDVMQLEMAAGGLVRKGIKAIKGAAESAGQKAPVLAEKELTTLQDVHTNLGDRVRAGAMEAQKMMEGFDYKYDKGQRVFTKDSAGKNKPPYTILSRTRVGNQVMREDHPEFGQGMGKPIIDPETGKAMRTPYEPGYRVRMERSPDDWSEFEIPEKAIVGDVEMAAGGLVKGLKAAAKAVKGTQDVLPAAEREANKAKFLEPSAVKERMYHGTTANINQFKPQTGDAVFLTPDPKFANKFAWNDMLFTASPQDSGFINPGANVMPVHVQAKNPFDYENPKHIRSVLSNLDPRDKKAFKKAASEGSWQEIEKHIGTIQDTGFDSVFLKEMGRKNLAVFEPSQIKSAIGNRGTYDINDPDLNKADGGAVRMQAGGLAKAAKALKAAKEAPMKASEALGRVEGRPLVITQADRTKVGGGFLGGPGFSGLQLEDPAYRAAEAAWGVKTPGVAKMILGGGKAAGKDPVYAAMLGTPTQHQSNQMVFDKLYGDFKKSAKKGNLDPELRDRINMRLANTVDKEGNPIFPPDVDILGKNFKELANTFDRRAVTANLIGGMGVGGKKGQIIDYDKIIRETTDPLLLDAPTGALGNRLFTLSGGIIDRPDLHPAFPTILQGEDLGVSFNPVARDLIMKDFMEQTMREKGRAPGYMDYTRGYPPSQLITEDLLTELQKLGLKEGGAVHKAVGGDVHGLSTTDLIYLQSQEDLGKLPPHAQNEAIHNMGRQEVRQRMSGKHAAGGKVTTIGSQMFDENNEQGVQNPVHFTENPDAMRLALSKRN